MSQYLIDTELFKFAGGCLAFWTGLNYIIQIIPLPIKSETRKEDLDLRNRLVSAVHGIIAVLLSAY